jgi:cation transport regulator ChaC
MGIQEQRNPRFVPDNLEARFQPIANSLDCGKRHRDSALFATLTPHRDNTSLEVYTVDIKIAEFAHAQSASVQNFEQCIITATAPQGFALVYLNWLKQRLQFGPVKNSRQTTFARWRAQRHSGIDLDETSTSCPRKISSQR